MGTRCITKVFDEKGISLLAMYRQHDGYPAGHGSDLATFLQDLVIVNGMTFRDPPKIANGAGCLAAQLVKHFKDGPGGIYLNPTTDSGEGVSYLYEIHVRGVDRRPGEESKEQEPAVDPILVKVSGYQQKPLFEGNRKEFLDFTENEKKD